MSHAESPTPRDPLPTIWGVSDAMWEHFFVPLLAELDPAPKMGRPRADQRKCLDGIIYRARTGCQWNQLPEKFGSDSTVHRTLRRWDEKGVFDQVWALLIYHCEELSAVHWEWQSADGCLNKARFIGREKNGGIKRASQEKGLPRPRRRKGPAASAPTGYPLGATAERWASRPASLSRATAVRLLRALPERT